MLNLEIAGLELSHRDALKLLQGRNELWLYAINIAFLAELDRLNIMKYSQMAKLN